MFSSRRHQVVCQSRPRQPRVVRRCSHVDFFQLLFLILIFALLAFCCWAAGGIKASSQVSPGLVCVWIYFAHGAQQLPQPLGPCRILCTRTLCGNFWPCSKRHDKSIIGNNRTYLAALVSLAVTRLDRWPSGHLKVKMLK